MNHRKSFAACALSLALPFGVAHAQVVITEIMYDPAGVDSGHEWIEVYNETTSSVDLTGWKLYEGDANHNIIALGDKTLTPLSYAVIAQSAAKFEADYPEFSGQLFHAAFSLDNAGATFELRDKNLAAVDTVSYDSAWGALGDGNSLQRAPGDPGSFMPRTPSPGATMSLTTIPIKLSSTVKTKVPKQSSVKKSGTQIDTSSPIPAGNSSDTTDNDPVATSPASDHSSQSAAADSASDTGAQYIWWVIMAAFVIVVAGAVVASRSFSKREWNIVEESDDGV